METSKVYFTNLRTTPSSNLLDKMERLVKRAGIANIDFQNQFVAIKIHFGEPGNLAFIRPNYAARMATLLRNLGAKPFLTDCNTLYSGRRANAVDHLESAMENGFNPISAKCDVIIADGLKGTEYREIEIDGEYCKAPKIGSAIADADIIISMNHFKGHEQTGFGGALKNLGMGCASVGGKLELHSASQPRIDIESCKGCNICVKHCRHDAHLLLVAGREVTYELLLPQNLSCQEGVELLEQLCTFLGRHVGDLGYEVEVLIGGEIVDEETFIHIGACPVLPALGLRHIHILIAALHAHMPIVGLDEIEHKAEQSALACSVVTDETKYLAVVYLKLLNIDCHLGAECLLEVIDVDFHNLCFG